MKTIVTIVGLTFATLGFAQQAEIVNGFDGFEVWVNAETGELPQYWDGFNKNVEFNGMIVGTIECVEKNAVDPYEGLFSAQLTSTSIMGGPAVPGILTVGDFVVDWVVQDGDVVGGEAYTLLPQELNGQFKFALAGIDTGFVSIWFLENGVEVGTGRFEFTETTGGWTAFTVAIDYTPGAMPDSMNMMFSSSQSDPSAIPAGTVLEIDAIEFASFVSTEELDQNYFEYYPNPATDQVHIHLKSETKGWVNIVASSGAIVRSQSFEGKSIQLDVSELPAGIYQISVDGETTQMVQSMVIQ